MFRAALQLARIAALFLVVLVVGACVGQAGAVTPSGSPSTPPRPADPDRIVFRVDWEGGFVAPGTLLGQLPVIVVYADGRVITQGPQIEIYPGPMMPSLEQRTLSASALARLIDLAREKDLLRTVHYGHPGIADATDTVLTVNLDGRTWRVSAYALAEAGVDDGGGMLDEAAVKGRANLRSFIEMLTGLPDADFVDQARPHVITGLRVYAGPAIVVPDSELPGEQPAIDWPLGDLATAGTVVPDGGMGLRCQALAGDDLGAVLPVLEGANTLSTFRSGGQLYSLIVRPLLPGETGC